MTYQCFDVDVQQHVAHITFSRPEKRNSMIPAFWTELPILIKDLDQDGQVRAIVLSSTGPHFSSGMDVSVFGAQSQVAVDSMQERQRAARFYDTVKRLQGTFSCLEAARVPVLAAIQGGCIGAGVDLCTACDMRYATADAFFTVYETNLAMTADVGTFPRLCKLIPDGLVRELAYTGRAMPAAEAKEHGLINTMYETHEEMLSSVLDIAATIASKAPLAVYGCKKMILHARDHTVADTLDYVGLWNAGFFQRDEVSEAMVAAREKRAGHFSPLPSQPDENDSEESVVLPQ
ncbi:MAG: crotonase/enoyl-CoA hydratase family protein [Granulosicoccus sp.]